MSERIRRTERFGTAQQKRPEILDKPVGYYDDQNSRVPETIRVSFSDGTTAVYELRIKQPEPRFDLNLARYAVGYKYGGDLWWRIGIGR